MAKRWKNRPEGSTWGDWGEDDQLGRLNLLTQERIKAAVAEVRDGRSFCLSLDRKSTRLNSSYVVNPYAVFCFKQNRPTSLP